MGCLRWTSALLVALANFSTEGVAEAAGTGSPSIVFEESRFDFGRMDQGQEQQHDFWFRNRGDATLIVQDVLSSCGCTGALPDRKEVPAGERSKIAVTFRSGSFTGSAEKILTVRSNDPKQPAVTITIRADVQPVYLVTPVITTLGEIPRGKGAVCEVTVRDSKGRPFKINTVTVSHSDLKATVLPIEGSNGSGYRLRLSIDPKRNTGPFNFSVIPQTDRQDVPHPMILVSGFIAGPVRTVPAALYLGTIRDGQSFKPCHVTITNSGQDAVEIRNVDSGDPAIHTTVSTNAPGKTFQIEVTASKMPVGWFQRTMQIRTSESDMPLEVSLSGVVMKAPVTPASAAK